MLDETINLDDPQVRAALKEALPAHLPEEMRQQIMQVLHQQLRTGDARNTSIIDVMNGVIEGLGLSDVLANSAPEGVGALLDAVEGARAGNPFEAVRKVQEGVKSGAIRLGGKPIKNTGEKVGRNDPCPCGSGKKKKNCHR